MHTQRLSQPIAFPTATPSGASLASLLQGARDMVQRFYAGLVAATAPRPVTTFYIGETLRAARANRETDWRFRRSSTSSLLSHSSLHID